MARRYVYLITVVQAEAPLGSTVSLVFDGVPLKVVNRYARERRHFSGLKRYLKTSEARN